MFAANLPAPHAVHVDCNASAYLPALHSWQLVEPAVATEPLTHARHEVAAVAENVAAPAPQVAHDELRALPL